MGSHFQVLTFYVSIPRTEKIKPQQSKDQNCVCNGITWRVLIQTFHVPIMFVWEDPRLREEGKAPRLQQIRV